MKTSTRSNASILIFFTGLVLILLFLTLLISNWIIIIGVDSGIITNIPATPLIPFLIQSGLISITIGLTLTLTLSYFPLRPVNQLIHAIHAVAGGNYHTKIHLKYPKEFRKLSDSFNQMTAELSGIEMLHSDFIQNFSHEFKTPIMSIMGFASLMKKKNLSEEETAKYLDIIISECKRLSNLSSNVLNLSKVESISVLSDTKTYNVTEQIRESILLLERKWEQKSISFDLKLNECRINADPSLLMHVWVNLIDNAIKFSPPESIIQIQVFCTQEKLLFQITDQGIGMSKTTQKKIFDKFYQGDLSHATNGNGLGLSLVKKITELHHGKIEVISTPAQGSTFLVTLPV